MADFFKGNDKQPEPKPVVKEEITKIKIGESEYEPDQAQKYIELGKIAQEAEEKYDTKIDRVYPAFTKATQDRKELEGKLKDLEAKMPKTPQEYTDTQVQEARQAAQKIGIVTKDDFSKFMKENFYNLYAEQRSADRLLDETSNLEKEIDGKDGRPSFKQKDMLEYMKENNIPNPKNAYKIRYEKQLDAWKEKQFSSKNSGLKTLETSTAGAKQPKEIKITNDNLDQILKETLNAPIR